MRRKKEIEYDLFKEMNKFYQIIKCTIEKHPRKFLDTEIVRTEEDIKTKVFRKPNNSPAHWFSKTPKRYKQNAINIDIHRAKSISSNF